MVRRIILGAILVVVVGLCYVAYVRWSHERAMSSGEVSNGPLEPLESMASSLLPKAEPASRLQSRSSGTEETAQTGKSSIAQANASALATDSQPANAPNGMKVGGQSSRYQFYRQGNVTYRLDTENGRSCILYATLEEWRKPIVYKNGCGDRVTGKVDVSR